LAPDTHQRGTQKKMRTNIVIDDKLIAEAMKLSGARTKREAVEESLRLMVQLKRQEQIRQARGKLKWTGDLEAMRRD
jgi:Arc/MetJ family transcription regulator